MIPDIFKTGIKDLDLKYSFKSKNMMDQIPGLNLFNNKEDENILKKGKPKKFTNFTVSQKGDIMV